MADDLTQTSDILTDTNAFDRYAYFALRKELYFDQAVRVKPTDQTHRGAAVIFTIWNDLAAATTALTEDVDPDAVAMSDAQVTVTLAEYGNSVRTTAKARQTSYMEIDTDAANIIGYNAGDSIDTIAANVFAGGTNVAYATGGSTDPSSRGTVEANDTIVAYDIRKAVATLRTNAVPSLDAGFYTCFIHPSVSFDLRTETGAAAWRDPHVYVDTSNIYRGEIGAFEGARFIESPRCTVWTGSGSSSTNVYATMVVGFQAVAKAYSTGDGYGPDPQIVHGPVTDKLMRFRPTGWKHLVGYGVFRQAALRRIESASSLG